MKMGINEDFRDFLAALNQQGADSLIVGAFAVAYHGVPRATGDLDIFVRCTPDNAARVLRALEVFGAPIASTGLKVEDLATQGVIYQIGVPPRRIDVLTQLSGITFDEAWESRVQTEIEGIAVSFLDRETLLRNKRASGRAKDLADIQELGG